MRALVLAAVLALPAAARAETQKIGVLDMTVEGGADPTVGNQLTNRLAEVLGRRAGVKVIAPDDIRAMLEQEAKKQMLGCDDESCLAEIGGALGADLLVKGRVSKIEDGYGVSLSAVAPDRAESVGHVSETWGGASIGLLELVEPMVTRLLPPDGASLVGTLEVSGAPDGAQIFVDQEIRGTAPAGQMGGVPIGARRIRVAAEDYAPFETWVVVNEGRVTSVPVRLEPLESPPFYATWWFWTITGVAVAGAAAGTAVALTGGDDGGGGATGVNVSVNADSAFTGGR